MRKGVTTIGTLLASLSLVGLIGGFAIKYTTDLIGAKSEAAQAMTMAQIAEKTSQEAILKVDEANKEINSVKIDVKWMRQAMEDNGIKPRNFPK